MERAYHVCYKLYQADDVKHLRVMASSKEEAYVQATYHDIPEVEKQLPYSIWIDSVTFLNGRLRRFNTFEGNPY